MSKKSYSISVFGAGISGLAAAYACLRGGHVVSLYDPAGFESENASAMAAGMVAPYAEIEHMNGAWIDAGLAGVAFWQEFEGACGFSKEGSLLIAHEQDRYMLERFRAHLPDGKGEAVVSDTIEPGLSGFAEGLYLQDEGHLEPRRALDELYRLLKEGGAQFIQEARAPADITADFVIDARGMAAGDPDIRGLKGETLKVRNREFTLSRPVRLMHPRYALYIVPRGDGVFMAGATQIESEGGGVALRSAMELMSALYSLHPSFGDAEILELNAGIRPTYADNLPRITVNDNVISINGMFRHGYLLAPIMGQAAADYISGQSHEFWDLFTGDTHESDYKRRA